MFRIIKPISILVNYNLSKHQIAFIKWFFINLKAILAMCEKVIP